MGAQPQTYFDYALNRDLYVTRPAKVQKQPMHVMVTNAGTRIAYCLVYKICSGVVFGEDQEIILHMVSSKGTADHRGILMELDECGFHLLKGSVVSGEVDELYKDLDVAVIISGGEQKSGVSPRHTLAGNIIRTRQQINAIALYAKPDVKIVMVGPSTQLAMLKIYAMSQFEPSIPSDNFSAVTTLDESIAVAHLAAKLKTTTDKIKNVIIWGLTCPDVKYATVLAYPPGDRGTDEMVEVPVTELLKDDRWLRDDFVELIENRVLESDFTTFGKSSAMATVVHLSALFQGTTAGQYTSMGILSPESEPYMVPQGSPFSFPVTCKDGTWQVIENLGLDLRTNLSVLRTMHDWESDKLLCMQRVVSYIKTYEQERNVLIHPRENGLLADVLAHVSEWQIPRYLTPLPTSLPSEVMGLGTSNRSVMWEQKVADQTGDSEFSRHVAYSEIKMDIKTSPGSHNNGMGEKIKKSILKERSNSQDSDKTVDK